MITQEMIRERAEQNYATNLGGFYYIAELQLKVEHLESLSQKQGESDEDAFEKWLDKITFKATDRERDLMLTAWLASRRPHRHRNKN